MAKRKGQFLLAVLICLVLCFIWGNSLMPGEVSAAFSDWVGEVLEALRNQGRKLYVATSKPEVTAREILEHFDLSRYFSEICGATVDKTRSSKEEVIAYLLSLDGCQENSVMVGDTAFDVIGAAAHGIPTIGAAWGYGKTEDMVSAGAAAIAQSPEDLLRIIDEEAF